MNERYNRHKIKQIMRKCDKESESVRKECFPILPNQTGFIEAD